MLSQFVSPGYAMALFEHGSAGRAYLLKERVGSVDVPSEPRASDLPNVRVGHPA